MNAVLDYFEMMSKDDGWKGMIQVDTAEVGLAAARLNAWHTLLSCKRGDEYLEPFNPVPDLLRARKHG